MYDRASHILLTGCLVLGAISSSFADPRHNVAGSSPGGYSQWATDQYPGFDGLDDLPKPEKKDKGWLWRWFGIGKPEKDTVAEQMAYARTLEENGELKKAAKAYDAVVREWPSSPEAPVAQFHLAYILEAGLGEYEDAFEEFSYLLDFYPHDCPYAKVAERQYKIVNLMMDTRRTFFGMSFTGDRQLRQSYERVVQRAPGAEYVPEAMLKIAALRENDYDYEEAVKVYSSLRNRYGGTPEARQALYLEAKARMWLVRRLAYNLSRCQDTENYLRAALRNDPDHPNAEEMRKWLGELREYLAEDAWTRTRFYDSRQRTKHAAAASYAKFVSAYPDSPHAAEARRRIEELESGGNGGKEQ